MHVPTIDHINTCTSDWSYECMDIRL